MSHIKDEWDKMTIKELITYSLSILCMAAAIVAVFLGLHLEPRGEIHASVLTYFGISSAFCGSLLGISAHYSNELNKFKASVIDSLPTGNVVKQQL